VRHVLLPGGRALSDLIGKYRSLLAIGVYAGVTVVAYLAAWILRFELELPEGATDTLLRTLPVLLGLRLATSRFFRLTLGRWRFVSTGDVRRLLAAATLGTVLFYAVLVAFPRLGAVPRSVVLLEWTLSVLITSGVWLTYRTVYEYRKRARINGSDVERRVVLVGAGEAGNLLAREMLRSPTGYRVVAFVDDDPMKMGTVLQGVRVEGTTEALAEIAKKFRADEIVLSIPSATPERIRQIVSGCEAVDLPLKVLPGIQDVIEGQVNMSQLRPLKIEDLLGREPVRLELPELEADLRGKVALVTGAAGSIGSELSRQIATNRPEHLILLDQAETALFYLQRELRERFPELQMTFVVGDILDEALLKSLFATHVPSRVYHAAAYKHVGMMEATPRSALLNNALGTWRVAEAAGVGGAETFVLISTDKAVRPSSMMGATKRMAEQLIRHAQSTYPNTNYLAVRFGNVLGSNGSVVPIFQKQLAEGRPLTVTHPEVTRYFMTIAEAVQLVLQASLLPEARGRVAMLDMGAPVRIVDLARKMIRLSGADTSSSKIVFTGLQQGEKLHEELAAPEEAWSPTRNPKVRVIESARVDLDEAPVQPEVVNSHRVLEGLARGEESCDALLDLLRVSLSLDAAPLSPTF
jgi:FlaA1/EpsC-like NDP-sugar epimerase